MLCSDLEIEIELSYNELSKEEQVEQQNII